MATDDERRRAAEWLRGEVGTGRDWPGVERMAEALGVPGSHESGVEGRLLGRLAELIDPENDPGPRDLARAWGWANGTDR